MIEVVDYDPAWARTFEALRKRVWPAVADVAVSIEHVGSTAVPGLAAKPIIDIDVIVRAGAASRLGAIDHLAGLGYRHQGDLGVAGREAFRAPSGLPAHHLHVCDQAGTALRNHLTVRDHLRAHPDLVQRYGELKRRLALLYPEDIDAYVAGKTDFICRILAAAGLTAHEIAAIKRLNGA